MSWGVTRAAAEVSRRRKFALPPDFWASTVVIMAPSASRTCTERGSRQSLESPSRTGLLKEFQAIAPYNAQLTSNPASINVFMWSDLSLSDSDDELAAFLGDAHRFLRVARAAPDEFHGVPIRIKSLPLHRDRIRRGRRRLARFKIGKVPAAAIASPDERGLVDREVAVAIRILPHRKCQLVRRAVRKAARKFHVVKLFVTDGERDVGR